MKKILFLFPFLFFACNVTYDLTDAHPLFQGNWQSETFVMKDGFYFFKIEFNSIYNKVKVKKYKKTSFGGSSCQDSFEDAYGKQDNIIECCDNGRIYKFEYINDDKILIHYNGKKIDMMKI